MKKLLVLVILAVAGLAAIGFRRGWFQVTSDGGAGDKANITLTVDRAKIQQDKEKASNKVQEAKEKVAGMADQQRK
jgi:hypothetical protein